MTMGVILVAEIGWHEVLSPIKCKTTTTTSMIFLLGPIRSKDFVFLSFSQPCSQDLLSSQNEAEFPQLFSRICLCYGVLFFQDWRAILPNEVNAPN